MDGDRLTSQKSYWRSLQRLHDSPVFQDAGDEFPEGASSPPSGLSRRSLLKLMGASLALAGAASCRRPEDRILPYVSAPEGLIPGIPLRYATAASIGTGVYGLVVESHEGRPTKIEGNQMHPSSLGAASPWLQASILNLYDPDRVRRVRRRNDAEGAWEDATWEEFVQAWSERAAELEAAGGRQLALLLPNFASPTTRRLVRTVLERFPEAATAAYEPFHDANIFAGIEAATGRSLRPAYRLEKASTLAAFDCDFLLTESDAISAARGFSSGRRIESASDEMNRLYVVEASLSLTGANADHRLPLPPTQVADALTGLFETLRERGLSLPELQGPPAASLSGAAQAKLDLMAQDLMRSGSKGVVLAGRRQPPRSHSLALAINRALGSLGEAVTLHPADDVGCDSEEALVRLAEGIEREEITHLIVAGANPIYSAPADLGLRESFKKLTFIAQLSLHADETSELAHWHLPQTHFLEDWSDYRSADSTLSVGQPLIAPLFEACRSVDELLSLVVGDEISPSHSLVRETWRGLLPEEDFEASWRRALHDGVLSEADRGGASVEAPLVVAEAPPALGGTDSDALEAIIAPSSTLYDDRNSNNAWLQELPDPITKLTWGNAALMSPATAERLELADGDHVRLSLSDRAIEIPILILPGHADGCATLSIGYGRAGGGDIARGVGTDAAPLRTASHPFLLPGVKIEKVAGRTRHAQTQEHWSMEGRSIVREATLEQYRAQPDFATAPEANLKPYPLWDDPELAGRYQWGMVVDLNACIGCSACVVACQSENNIPIVGPEQVRNSREMHWLRIDRYYAGPPDDPEVVFQPVPCMHCERAPCEQVCPVAATVHDNEGLNVMVYNRCIGTRYCSNNCPYKVRRFNFFNYTGRIPELVQLGMNPDVTVRSRGVMEKCTYCVQRISESKIHARKEGRDVQDGELQTACQQTCPAQAIAFGDISDPNSQVSRWKARDRNYTLLADLHNKPRTTYLAKLRNPNPQWKEIR